MNHNTNKDFYPIKYGGGIPEPPPEIKYIYENWLGKYEPMFIQVKIPNGRFYYAVCSDWLNFKTDLDNNKVFGENGEPLDDDIINKHLEDFADGFMQGYHDFDKDIKHSTAIFNTSEIAQRVFSQIQKRPLSLSSWASNWRLKKNIPNLSVSKDVGKLHPGGIATGKLYKAWYFIVNNPEPFRALFREKYYLRYKMIRKDPYYNDIDYEFDLDILIQEIEIERSSQPQPLKTKADLLKESLCEYGFFELEKVSSLSEENQKKLVCKISESGLPYAIAMFEMLGFIRYLGIEHFASGDERNKEISRWFNCDSRGVKGNISVLSDLTGEDKTRYTSHLHKKAVESDYHKLK